LPTICNPLFGLTACMVGGAARRCDCGKRRRTASAAARSGQIERDGRDAPSEA